MPPLQTWLAPQSAVVQHWVAQTHALPTWLYPLEQLMSHWPPAVQTAMPFAAGEGHAPHETEP